ncbi:hypothetical protein LSH36_255g05027 [Paralvinella palmiformis]|uniref:ETS domain-containing protein n=1 Tax=Paralvinella palmiformis TaxID=53620 RepID=A0AAD9N4N2_9ANNE|nr:hypothetical protein LSH36_255g05027 [Paralvinella palmiformis]
MDSGTPVTVQQIPYPTLTQADLDMLIRTRDEESDASMELPWTTKTSETNDEGYGSSTSPKYFGSESGDSQSENDAIDSMYGCATDDIITEILYYGVSHLDDKCVDSESKSPATNNQDPAVLFHQMSSTARHMGILDQIVPEDIQELFPSLNNLSYTDVDNCMDLDLTKSIGVVDIGRCQHQKIVESPDDNLVDVAAAETNLPEFDVLLDNDYNDVVKQATRTVNKKCKTTRSVNSLSEENYEEQEEESSDGDDGDDDDDNDTLYDPDDEDYIPPVYNQLPSSRRTRRHSPQLWVFLLNCLCDPKLNPSVIGWEDKTKGIFRLKDSKHISDLWGKRLAKVQTKPMDYEKFSRAIRYYYHKGVIISHPKRLTYQFGPKAKRWHEKIGGAAV